MKSLSAIVIFMTVALTSHAGVVNYNEGSGGDLSPFNFSSPPSHTFTFDLGTNSVQGRAGLFGGDYDSFGFVIPVGMQLVRTTFDVWNAQSGVSSISIGRLYAGVPGSGTTQASSDTPIVLPSFSAIEVFRDGPFGAGTYYWGCCGGSGSSTSSSGYNWSMAFVVEQAPPPPTPPVPVPTPAPMALLLIGLMGLLVKRRQLRA